MKNKSFKIIFLSILVAISVCGLFSYFSLDKYFDKTETSEVRMNQEMKLVVETYYDVENDSFVIDYDVMENNKVYSLCFENDRGMSSMAITIGRNKYSTPTEWYDAEDVVYSVYVIMGIDGVNNKNFIKLGSDEEGVHELLDFNENCKLTVYELPFTFEG